MRNRIQILGFVLIITSCTMQNSQRVISQRIQNIENGLVEFTTPAGMFEPDSSGLANRMTLSERMVHYKVPGVSIAVIDANTIEWAKGYGFCKQGTEIPVTTGTLFQAASTSKLLTSVIALHFVEEGKLALDEDVNTYLKSWKIPGNECTREKKVTLRLLLTHQSGLPTTNFNHDEKKEYPTLIQVLQGETPALNKPAFVEFIPGTAWQYSNVGYDVIQLLLEDVSGKPFSQIAMETLFKPLGMKSSTFDYPLKLEFQAKEAMPHDSEGISREPAMHHTALAHGGLMTTPSDLARFICELMRAYQGLSSRILSPKMARELFRKELDLDPRMFGIPLGEGLGVFLFTDGSNPVFAHPGSNLPGTNCWLIGTPESGKGAVIMTNGAMGEVLSMEILTAVIQEYQWTGA
jgi:CubicO group peptidase (beta-lactamase class C family)